MFSLKVVGKTLRLAGALLTFLLAGCGGDAERLNVVLISLDTCRADRLGAYGAPRPTPSIDHMAGDSVRFADALSQSGSTGPSHMSILTGHYVHRHRLIHNGMGSDSPRTLASVLREAGWRTGAFTGHGSFQKMYGHGRGFEVFESGAEGIEWPYTRHLPEVIPEALAWLDGLDAEPFFLLVHGYDPHSPFWPPEPWRSEMAGWYDGPLDPSRMLDFNGLMWKGELSPNDLRYLSDLYDAEVAAADQAVGMLLEELQKRGLLERSVVVFTSDHGEDLGERDHIGHVKLSEQILRVPLIIRFPQRKWTGVIQRGVEHVDLMPTLLSALGVPPPPGLHGVDLMPLVRGEGSQENPERMRLAQRRRSIAVRFDPRWKAEFELRNGEATLPRIYDLEGDPQESLNLIRGPVARGRFDEIVRRYLAWRDETAADDERYGAREATLVGTPDQLKALGYLDIGEDEEETLDTP